VEHRRTRRRMGSVAILLFGLFAVSAAGVGTSYLRTWAKPTPALMRPIMYAARKPIDASGFAVLANAVKPWQPNASLTEVRNAWTDAAKRFDRSLAGKDAAGQFPRDAKIPLLLTRASLVLSDGDAVAGYNLLKQARSLAESDDGLTATFLPTLVYFQAVASLRRGENDNCIMCRGESSCILPIAKAAQHLYPEGSRTAIAHFTEYLEKFPNDLEARWLLNLAHMTLGEYPDKVEPRYLVSMDKYLKSEFDIGRFRDIGHRVGVNRLNQAGGAIMEDFDGDGLLDLVVTAFDAREPMAFYRNDGQGGFDDRSVEAGVTQQYGGLFCVQADYDNDGLMDVYVARGAWINQAVRPSLLRNQGGGVFADVTGKAGLLDPLNSNSACWADYDNDGHVDMFVCGERQRNRLYHNKGNGTFEEVGVPAGVHGDGRPMCKGATWIDYDNDGDPDLFLNYLSGMAVLYRNDGKGVFTDVSMDMGVDGPLTGFSCWTFDYDNDGWLDVFATSYDRSLRDVVKGLMGQPHSRTANKLYHNEGGKRFVDETRSAGLDMCFATMGSNFADFDNDGWLDFYLGTGEPSYATLIPNRMFKNVEGRRFAEITASSGTGLLQKGHAVACGDFDRDGDVDIFAQTGGAVDGDKYHNVLFENPGQGRKSLTLRLIGKKTNRAAIGARIKVTTAGTKPLSIHRHVSSGSSFGANTLEQTIGLGDAARAAVEVYWPTSKTTQMFNDVVAGQVIEITEFASDYRKVGVKRPDAAKKANVALKK
jgi:FG-GAP-like repeat/ASPIC and UnbV